MSGIKIPNIGSKASSLLGKLPSMPSIPSIPSMPSIDSIGDMGGGKVNKFVILVLALLIIIISSSGYYVKKYCKEESITINTNMLQFFMGFGTGLIFYLIFNVLKIVSVPIIIMLGLFFSVIGSIYVNIYSKMSKECKKDTIGSELSFGMLGCGIGILTFVILYNSLAFIPTPTLKWRIIGLIFNIFLIVIPSITINMINKCGDNYESDVDTNKIKSIKTGQIVSLVISIVIFIGICASFVAYPV